MHPYLRLRRRRVGSHLAAKLSAAGNDVSIVTRGPHLAAIRERGILLHTGGRVIGGVVYSSNGVVETGVVHNGTPNRDILHIGGTHDRQSTRVKVEAIVKAPHAFARAAGLDTPTLDVMVGLAANMAAAKGLYSAA